MKKFIVNKIMNYIKQNTNYDDIKLKEIEYGLASIYITITKMIIIFLIAYLLGILKYCIIYTLAYNILRMTSFGIHATKSWICLITSIILFLGIPYICLILNINIYVKTLIGIIGTIFMFKNSPADTYKRPIVNRRRRKIYKYISTTLCFLFFIFSIILKNYFISNCLVFSIVMQNIMISPITYKLFKLPYNNYITFLQKHPEFEY